MAESFSFYVVSDFARQELVNTLDQVKSEISQRYDLKGTDTSVELDKENIFIITNSELTLNAVHDIIRQKAIKRKLSLKIFDYGEIEMVSGDRVKQTILLKQGIQQEIGKKISKNIRDQIKKIIFYHQLSLVDYHLLNLATQAQLECYHPIYREII